MVVKLILDKKTQHVIHFQISRNRVFVTGSENVSGTEMLPLSAELENLGGNW